MGKESKYKLSCIRRMNVQGNESGIWRQSLYPEKNVFSKKALHTFTDGSQVILFRLRDHMRKLKIR